MLNDTITYVIITHKIIEVRDEISSYSQKSIPCFNIMLCAYATKIVNSCYFHVTKLRAKFHPVLKRGLVRFRLVDTLLIVEVEGAEFLALTAV